jgi:hypothetical protein
MEFQRIQEKDSQLTSLILKRKFLGESNKNKVELLHEEEGGVDRPNDKIHEKTES